MRWDGLIFDVSRLILEVASGFDTCSLRNEDGVGGCFCHGHNLTNFRGLRFRFYSPFEPGF